MARSFNCPRCGGRLNPGTKVILVAERGPERGLVLLSPDFGDYAAVLAESFRLQPGQAYTFACPICHADLASPLARGLVEIEAVEDDGTRERVDFSCVAGEHATFVRGPSGVQCFGEHVARYDGVNFFGAGPEDDLRQ
jgi:hypothetical protein